MNIEVRRLEDLKPYENNPRNNEAAVENVKKSIEQFGFKIPIVIDKGGTIVCGHTRYKAALELNFETVPCVVADDLNEQQVKAFRLVDNKTAEIASWDYSKLEEELADISEINMSEFDFEIPDVSEESFEGFFEDSQESQAEKKESKLVTCPYCGKSFSP